MIELIDNRDDGTEWRYQIRTRGDGTVDCAVEVREPGGWVRDGELCGNWDGVSLTGLPTVPHEVKARIVRGLVLADEKRTRPW